MNCRMPRAFLSRAFLIAGLAFFFAVPAIEADAAIFRTDPIVPAVCRGDTVRDNPSGCTLCHLAVMTNNLTDFLTRNIAFPSAVLLFVAGGIVLMTAGPSETRVGLGKKILSAAIWGLLIVMLAWIGVDTIIKVLTGTGSSSERGTLSRQWGPWNKIPAGRLQDCAL